MNHEKVPVEVAYATLHEQVILPVNVSSGSHLSDAIDQSGVLEQFPEIDLGVNKVGVFGRVVKAPDKQAINEGDRIEIYRPLIKSASKAKKG